MKFGNLNLFPLDTVRNSLGGYYLAADFSVYSTKRGNDPIKLTGSKIFSHSPRTYTLNGQSYSDAYLKTLVTANSVFYKSFKEHTTPTIAAALGVSASSVKPSNRSHAASAAAGIKSKGVVIAQVAVHEGVEHLLFGSKPAIHLTEQSYRDEMTRLAAQKPGTKFVALKIVSSVVSGGVQWE